MNADPDPEVAALVNLTVLSEKFSTLPNAGGLLDQPYTLVFGMRAVLEAQQERFELDNPKLKK
jgi:hypothetical protein